MLLDNYLAKKHNAHQRNADPFSFNPPQCKSKEEKVKPKIDMRIKTDINPFEIAMPATTPQSRDKASNIGITLSNNINKALDEKTDVGRSPIRANVNFFDADQLMTHMKQDSKPKLSTSSQQEEQSSNNVLSASTSSSKAIMNLHNVNKINQKSIIS